MFDVLEVAAAAAEVADTCLPAQDDNDDDPVEHEDPIA